MSQMENAKIQNKRAKCKDFAKINMLAYLYGKLH